MALPQRKLHRLKSWDYHQIGYYFVTICTHGKKKQFSHIRSCGIDATLELTPLGKQVEAVWRNTESIYPGIKLDAYCFMPNHLHAIVIIEKESVSLSDVIQAFKSVTTRAYNKTVLPENKNKLWQSSFYDEIIRSDAMLYEIRKYIMGNPSKWLEDTLYVE